MTITRGDSHIHVQRRRGSWVAAPLDIITHNALTSNAKIVLIYMLALSDREGWVIKVSHLKAKLKLGDAAWVAARNNLAIAGYFKSTRVQVEKGKFVWLHEASDAAEFTNSDAAIPGFPMDGSPIHGEPGDVVINSQAITKKQQHARVPAGATLAAASTSIKGKESKALAIIQGVTCWTHADKQAAGQLAETYGAAAVERAAQTVREGGAIPLPGRVFLKLQRSAEEDRAATAIAATQRRLAELEAMSRSRGAREMDEMLAAKPEPEPRP